MHEVLSDSAATDGDDDFELVSVGQQRGRVLALRDNFSVAFDGDALAGVAELLDQAGDTERGGELPRLAVDGDVQHIAILAAKADACRTGCRLEALPTPGAACALRKP